MSRQDGSHRQVTTGPVDDATATVLHVDMDAFFASVELLERPDLVGRPVIVGGASGRSVVLSATYEARRFGVRSAMPMASARRLCPQAVVLEPHRERYSYYSHRVMEIFERVTPLIEKVSIDEAFLDVAGARRRLGPPTRIAELLRRQVRQETELPCSVGAAATKFVAKLASSQAKPDGLLVVPARETGRFLRPLPVSALWGVGGATEKTLSRLGLRRVGDIADTPRDTLERALGPAVGAHLHALAHGIDPRPVTPRTEEKSVGHEVTFDRDVDDPDRIRRELLRLSDRTAVRLRAGGWTGRTVVLKLRFADFRTITRSRTLPEATDLGREIYAAISRIYDGLGLDRARIRLVGVRAEQLASAGRTGRQLELGQREVGWQEAERAMDSVTARFGAGALRRATLVDRAPADPRAPDGPRPSGNPAEEPGVAH